MKIFTLKKDHVGLSVSKIFLFTHPVTFIWGIEGTLLEAPWALTVGENKQTHKQTSYYFYIRNLSVG